MKTFIENKKKISHFFIFHKSLRKNVPICHIAATPLRGCGGRMLELLGKIALSSSWTGRVDTG
jgi:hypothetical protein